MHPPDGVRSGRMDAPDRVRSRPLHPPHELRRLAEEPVSDDELARARALIESAELGALGRMEEVADRLSMYATLFDRPQLVNEQLDRYLAVDADLIRETAARVFRPDNIAVLTYVPAAAGAMEEAA